MALIVALSEVLQDCAAFPDLELLALLVCVDDGGDTAVGIDGEVPCLFLLMFEELDLANLYVCDILEIEIFVVVAVKIVLHCT